MELYVISECCFHSLCYSADMASVVFTGNSTVRKPSVIPHDEWNIDSHCITISHGSSNMFYFSLLTASLILLDCIQLLKEIIMN